MAANGQYVLGVDIGGTFTDTVIVDDSGQVVEAKVHSTPKDFSRGFIDSIKEGASKLGRALPDLLKNTLLIKHGLTVASNAVATRNGATVGLITTKGHEDAIFVMRAIGRVAGLPMDKVKFIARTDKPEPLVPKARVRGVTERVDYKGSVIVPLDPEDTPQVIEYLLAQGVDSIALSLLWSFMNPSHEHQVMALLRGRRPDVFAVASSDVCPVIGEYERTTTTVLDAYVGPVLKAYLMPLQARLREMGYEGPLLVLQASGGVVPPEAAIAHGVGTVDAGPTAGVVATSLLCESLGTKNAVATDVGGTTFKVGFVVDGVIPMAREAVLGQYTVSFRMIDTVFIGTGGGSIAWVDPVTKTLHVGPQSAGADPGPACYGFGGEEPTVSDAELVLGYLDPNYFLGGKMRLYKNLAERAIGDKVGKAMGMDVVESALGIHQIATSSFSDLLRSAFFARGYDPHDFVLFSYGGAGPLFGASLARELGISRVIVPFMATVHSAFGSAACDVIHVHEKSQFMAMPVDPRKVNEIFSDLEKAALKEMMGEGFQDIASSRSIDVRYHFQEHLVETPAPPGEYTEQSLQEICDSFERKYEQLYGRGSAYREAGIDLVTFKVTSRASVRKPKMQRRRGSSEDPSQAVRGKREVYWEEKGGFFPTAIYDASGLLPGNRLEGPTVAESFGHTVVIPPGFVGKVDEYLNLVLESVR